ncbi:hypothetical protein TeGR_g5759, partial [Tetraparma gracilis]
MKIEVVASPDREEGSLSLSPSSSNRSSPRSPFDALESLSLVPSGSELPTLTSLVQATAASKVQALVRSRIGRAAYLKELNERNAEPPKGGTFLVIAREVSSTVLQAVWRGALVRSRRAAKDLSVSMEAGTADAISSVCQGVISSVMSKMFSPSKVSRPLPSEEGAVKEDGCVAMDILKTAKQRATTIHLGSGAVAGLAAKGRYRDEEDEEEVEEVEADAAEEEKKEEEVVVVEGEVDTLVVEETPAVAAGARVVTAEEPAVAAEEPAVAAEAPVVAAVAAVEPAPAPAPASPTPAAPAPAAPAPAPAASPDTIDTGENMTMDVTAVQLSPSHSASPRLPAPTVPPAAPPPPPSRPAPDSSIPRDQVILLIVKEVFTQHKSRPLTLQCTEVVKILQALDVCSAAQLARMESSATLRMSVKIGNERFSLPLDGPLKDLTTTLQAAWADLDDHSSRKYKLPPSLSKQTRKHLTDLMRLPPEAVKFLQETPDVAGWDAETFSSFLAILGVKTAQYHQSACLHVSGRNLELITEEALGKHAGVLRSTLLRRRIAAGVQVLAQIKEYEAGKLSSAAHGSMPPPSSSGKNVVSDLRKSVSELQMSLYSKESTIAHLRGKVEKLQNKVVDAGLVLSPNTPDDRFQPTPGRGAGGRSLYREDAEEAAQYLPVPRSLETSMKPEELERMGKVEVDKGMWEDHRVLKSPVRPGGVGDMDPGGGEQLWQQQKGRSAPAIVDPSSKRVPLKTSTAFFSPQGMSIHTGERAKTAGANETRARFNEDVAGADMVRPNSPSRMKAVHAQLHLLNLTPGSPPRSKAAQPKSLIRRGSPFKERPVTAAANPDGMPDLAKGTSHKAANVLKDLWVGSAESKRDEVTGFMYSASGAVVKKKKGRGRRGAGGKKEREIGGVGEARLIIEGGDGDDSDEGGEQRDEDATNLDDIVAGDYLDAFKERKEGAVGRAAGDENREPAKQERKGKTNQGDKVVKMKDAPASPMSKKLNRINKEVTTAQKRLDKQLKMLRGKGLAADPK